MPPPQLDLLNGLEEALSDPDPYALLDFASVIASAASTDPMADDAGDLFDEDDERLPLTLAELCELLIGAGNRQTDAVLRVFAEFQPDVLLRERARNAVAERRHPIPGWVIRIGDTSVLSAMELTHVQGDGDDVLIEVEVGRDRRMTLLVYIDHNLGTVVKDAFVLPVGIEEVVDRIRISPDFDNGQSISSISLADARARIDGSIARGDAAGLLLESETWPRCRPIVEWIARLLPAGGADYEEASWTSEDLQSVIDRFLASDFGKGFGSTDPELVSGVVRFGMESGLSDPLRWSPVSVEVFLTQWIPLEVTLPESEFAPLPDLLRAYIRFCDAERGVPSEIGQDSIDAVDEWMPVTRELLAADWRRTFLANTDRLRQLESMSIDDYVLESLVDAVGGEDALSTLDSDPLPIEPFDRGGIPADILPMIDEVAELIDGCCAAMFDEEFRTACWRLLARVAASDPAIFRRRSSPRMAAGAICWMIGRANQRFTVYGGPRVKDLQAHLGVASAFSQRSEAFVRALGRDRWARSELLGDAGLLIGAQRAEYIAVRDELRESSSD